MNNYNEKNERIYNYNHHTSKSQINYDTITNGQKYFSSIFSIDQQIHKKMYMLWNQKRAPLYVHKRDKSQNYSFYKSLYLYVLNTNIAINSELDLILSAIIYIGDN